METGIRSFEERELATFRHEPVERIVWQPRFSDWYRQNHIHELRRDMPSERIAELASKCPDLPPDVYGMEEVEIYDFLNASPRYPGECWPSMGFFYTKGNPDADIQHEWVTDPDGYRHHKITTLYGVLTEGWKAGSSYPDERMLKTREDFKAVLYYVENTCVESGFNETMFEMFQEENHGRCVSSGGPWRSPYNKCIVELAGTKATMILMKRYTEEFDAFCDELVRINNDVILPTLMKSPVDVITCGDNVDCRNDPPYVYEKYILPYFENIAKESKRVGKFTHAHFDGALEDLLPYFGNDIYPFDGIEAPTFRPQGNLDVKDFRQALGDRVIVLDGIPSTIFLPYYPEQQFVDLVNEVLALFSPNLILGVSDEYSPNGLFGRLQMVADLVEKFVP
ncbi:MAG TPA: hypothetical protein VKK79_25200 [Candidatus Lokiarchaeia archaeon]|nr:hypothetical protein [Candidatus Lokiarchaeia archaeon]